MNDAFMHVTFAAGVALAPVSVASGMTCCPKRPETSEQLSKP
jgi:hypothetical protein